MQLFNALLLLLLFSFSHAEDMNTTLAELNATQEILIDPKLREQKILEYQKELNSLEGQISKEKVWMKSYASYITSLEVKESLENIKKRIVDLRAQRRLSDAQHEELAILLSKELVLKSQMEMLSKTEVSPFASLLTPPHLEESHSITNPFEILTGISLLKTYNADFKEYLQRKDELTQLIDLIKQENAIYSDMLLLENNETLQKEADFKTKQLERFERALDTITVSADVHQKRLEVIELNINKDITTQLYKLANISIIVMVIFVFFFLIKIVVKKYITDHERFYMANKMITFANVTIIIIVLFFSYIENASYLVTILGFASAGIAIAMKDWFMSILGWLVIVLGGSIHVGDRIKVTMDGVEYVGDIMDISLLRMTLFEDVTLTTYMANRRAGRIIFIPNNYVFTRMIANYSHASLKT
ncbi:MAG: mechanosensitive ion channel, partial [Epsilonproteobacteria bacterium]|nr:mechanosensitive ion channel [Campylobacterota bacterium]